MKTIILIAITAILLACEKSETSNVVTEVYKKELEVYCGNTVKSGEVPSGYTLEYKAMGNINKTYNKYNGQYITIKEPYEGMKLYYKVIPDSSHYMTIIEVTYREYYKESAYIEGIEISKKYIKQANVYRYVNNGTTVLNEKLKIPTDYIIFEND